MKDKIHPTYEETTITCVCGNVMTVKSTGKDMQIGVCSSCHPFYTGSGMSFLDSASRVAQFRKRYGQK